MNNLSAGESEFTFVMLLMLTAGGDDVNQLCEAGEEEFLEIMALVGMASKPLHVRRLQKALLEWIMEPGDYSARMNSFFIYSQPGILNER